MKEDKLISALIGLVGACSNNPKTEHTDQLLIKALAFPLAFPDHSEAAFQEILSEIYTEKTIIAPDCAHCAFPCGNTSDYDMRRIDEAEDEIRLTKRQILQDLKELAVPVYRRQLSEAGPEPDCSLFYRALALVSYDVDCSVLSNLLNEIAQYGSTD